MAEIEIGQTLERYRILDQIGEGGMGVVYKAHDTRLDRLVAIKVLRHDRAADPEWRKRLNRESKAASALNHPNIITIHDVNSIDGLDYIVMEYIEGTPLDRVVPPGGLPLKEVLRYGIALADALGCAHQAGILHRDFKPGNVLVSASGAAKIVDFGLAKVIEREPKPGADSTETFQPGGPPSREGVILGSVPYMSPEQVECRRLDNRSDVFSFGTVLYEVSTGISPFHRSSRMSTLAAIARETPPPLREVNPRLPPDFCRIVGRCLEKDPARRFQTMHEVRDALEQVRSETESGYYAAQLVARQTAREKRWRRWLLAALALAVGASLWMYWREPQPGTGAPDLVRLTLDAGLSTDPSISRDGRLVVYTSNRANNRDIWLQQVSGGQPLRLTNDPADEHSPHFSPDATEVVFYSARDGGGLYIVPTLGGGVRKLADSPFWYPGPRFSPDGRQVAFRGRSNQLCVVSKTGGDVNCIDIGLQSLRQHIWTPDGGHLLFRARAPGDDRTAPEWYVMPVSGGDPVATGAVAHFRKAGLSEAYPGSWLGNRVLFTAGNDERWHVWEMGIDTRSWQVRSEPRQLTFGTGWEDHPSASETGLVALFSGTYNRDLYALPIDSRTGRATSAPERLTETLATDSWPSVSADGKTLAYSSNRTGIFHVWLRDLTTGFERPITSGYENKWGPAISGDGSQVAYTETRQGRTELFVISAQGGEARRLLEDVSPLDWHPLIPRLLVLERDPAEQMGSILLLDTASGETSVLFGEPGQDFRSAMFSPDGEWLAVWLYREGKAERHLVPFRGSQRVPSSEWKLIEAGGAVRTSPVWSPDAGSFYWFSRRGGTIDIWRQGLQVPVGNFVGEPELVYRSDDASREISSERLVAAKGRLFYSQWEVLGNVWTMRLPVTR